MKLWRAGRGAFFAALLLACGGQAEGGDDDDPSARERTGTVPRLAPPSAPPPAYQGNTAPPPAANNPPDRVDPALPLGEGDLQQQVVEAMLGRYCGNCHGAAAVVNGTVMGGFDSVEDIDQLVEEGYIVPFKPEVSLLVQRVRNGDMPPASVRPRPSQSEIRALESFVSTGDLSF